MKKLISVALCAVMLVTSALISVSAVTKQPYFELVGKEIFIPANKILKSAYNLKGETNFQFYVHLEDENNSNNSMDVRFEDCFNNEKLINVGTGEYKVWDGYRSGKSTGGEKVSFNEGAYYQKVRVKLSEVKDEYYLQRYENGEWVYITRSYFDEKGNYVVYDRDRGESVFDFTNTENVMESGMYIVSGAAMTAVKPDKNGMVEFYMKKEMDGIPDLAGMGIKYNEHMGRYCVGFGGDLKLGMGNVDLNSTVNVTDATLIQKYCSGLDDLGAVQKYFADVNGDGVVNVIDSTEIQKYCVGI